MESTVTMPLHEFLEMRDKIKEQENIINQVLSSGEQYTIDHYKYSVINPDEATKMLISASKNEQEYKSLLRVVLSKSIPTRSNEKTVIDLFKHDERFKDWGYRL
jgi:hypothetical protein